MTQLDFIELKSRRPSDALVIHPQAPVTTYTRLLYCMLASIEHSNCGITTCTHNIPIIVPHCLSLPPNAPRPPCQQLTKHFKPGCWNFKLIKPKLFAEIRTQGRRQSFHMSISLDPENDLEHSDMKRLLRRLWLPTERTSIHSSRTCLDRLFHPLIAPTNARQSPGVLNGWREFGKCSIIIVRGKKTWPCLLLGNHRAVHVLKS